MRLPAARGGCRIKKLSMTRSILTVLSAMAVCSSAAQIGGTVPVEHAFAHGEELEYAVSYKVSFVNTDVAGVTFRTTLGDYGGRRAYTVDAHGVVYPFYKWFFDLTSMSVRSIPPRCGRWSCAAKSAKASTAIRRASSTTGTAAWSITRSATIRIRTAITRGSICRTAATTRWPRFSICVAPT